MRKNPHHVAAVTRFSRFPACRFLLHSVIPRTGTTQQDVNGHWAKERKDRRVLERLVLGGGGGVTREG